MLCIYAIAMDPERKGHLYKVTGETLEELWNKEAYSAVGKTRLHRQVENQNEHAI